MRTLRLVEPVAHRHPYHGRVAALATRHRKLASVAPALRNTLGLEVVSVDVDTDSFGTFSGEIGRQGTPFDVAVAKARVGMARSSLSLGVASEGSFGPDDAVPFLTADTELVVLVDDESGIVVVETCVDLVPPSIRLEVNPRNLDMDVLVAGGFPAHGVIVRPVGAAQPVMKGIHGERVLRRAIDICAMASPTATARIESDFRAHHHPSRRGVIERATNRLARRLKSLCPACDSPGWGVTRREPGARCRQCAAPTRMPLAEHWGCVACSHSVAITVQADGADPARCVGCNP